MNRLPLYRVALVLLTAALVAVSAAYVREHQRAEMGEQYYSTLNHTRKDLEIVEQERDSLRAANAHLKEQELSVSSRGSVR